MAPCCATRHGSRGPFNISGCVLQGRKCFARFATVARAGSEGWKHMRLQSLQCGAMLSHLCISSLPSKSHTHTHTCSIFEKKFCCFDVFTMPKHLPIPVFLIISVPGKTSFNATLCAVQRRASSGTDPQSACRTMVGLTALYFLGRIRWRKCTGTVV